MRVVPTDFAAFDPAFVFLRFFLPQLFVPVFSATCRNYDAQTGSVKRAEQIGSQTAKNGAFSAVPGKISPFNDGTRNGVSA